MEWITELYEDGRDSKGNSEEIRYTIRKASRAVVQNKRNQIALLRVTKHRYHKLPGGGIEAGENIESALRREVLEEAGVHIDVLDEIGIIVEYRDTHGLLQFSYCYFAHVVGGQKEPAFTEEELVDGFELQWVGLEEAIGILEKDDPDDYMGKFIRKRDLAFLRKTLELLDETAD